MKQIDEWERQSIDNIRQAAAYARTQLLYIIEKRWSDNKKTLGLLTQQINKACEDDEFVETDINRWKKTLEELKKEMNTPETLTIQQDNKANALISKIFIKENAFTTDVFERTAGYIRIEDNGRLIIHDPGHDHEDAAIRGRNAYFSGQHRFRFKIEQLDYQKKWAFFGIISKDAAIEQHSYFTATSYGWAGGDQVYLNGKQKIRYGNYKSDMTTNDTLELSVDCDRRKIQLTNERTRSKYELDVDIAKCPFPWQLSFCISHSRDRIVFL